MVLECNVDPQRYLTSTGFRYIIHAGTVVSHLTKEVREHTMDFQLFLRELSVHLRTLSDREIRQMKQILFVHPHNQTKLRGSLNTSTGIIHFGRCQTLRLVNVGEYWELS